MSEYRAIDDAEVQDAVQQLYGVQLVLFGGVTTDSHHADGDDAHRYYWVRINHRLEGTEKVLKWDKLPWLSDMGCDYRRCLTDDGSKITANGVRETYPS